MRPLYAFPACFRGRHSSVASISAKIGASLLLVPHPQPDFVLLGGGVVTVTLAVAVLPRESVTRTISVTPLVEPPV